MKKIPSELFKYLSFEGALKTLQGASILLRRPSTFNDPFDMQPTSSFVPLSPEELRYHSAVKVARSLKNKSIPMPKPPPYLSMKAAENSNRLLQELPEEELITRFTKSVRLDDWNELISHEENLIKKGMEGFFVSCFSTNSHNLLMWAHYAESHRGAMLKFRGNPQGEISFIYAAKEVNYSEGPMPLGLKEDWVRYIHNPNESIDKDTLVRFLTNKSKQWEYESEWRIMLHQISDEMSGSDRGTMPFNPLELEAVYLGYWMSLANRNILIGICEEMYPHALVFETAKIPGSFKMQYNRIR